MRRAVLVGMLASLAGAPAARADDEFGGGRVIFVRGASLFETDPRGRAERELAKLPTGGTVRALRTDARGTTLLADLDGTWWWMPLDGVASSLTELPCADGPAQLALEGTCVLCRSKATPTSSVIISLKSAKEFPVAVPTVGARLTGVRPNRRLVWADAAGIWASPPGDPRRKTEVVPDAPLRSFVPSPDGTRGVGVYADQVHVGKETRPAELLMSFALDGQGARRKAIKAGVPIEWSHDSRWVLVQDRGSACVMSAIGGQYKCWKGYTGVSVASDGRWALLLGNRSKIEKTEAKKSKKERGKRDKRRGKAKRDEETQASASSIEPTGESENQENEDSAPVDDVEVPPPAGPLALFRAELEGAYTKSPALVVREVDGAAVWVPARR